MRSVSVVFPESMCAEIPMLRNRPSGESAAAEATELGSIFGTDDMVVTPTMRHPLWFRPISMNGYPGPKKSRNPLLISSFGSEPNDLVGLYRPHGIATSL